MPTDQELIKDLRQFHHYEAAKRLELLTGGYKLPRQDGLISQLLDLVTLANHHGLYNAADWLGVKVPHDL